MYAIEFKELESQYDINQLLQEYNKLLGENIKSQDWTCELQDCLLGLLKSPVTILKQPCIKTTKIHHYMINSKPAIIKEGQFSFNSF